MTTAELQELADKARRTGKLELRGRINREVRYRQGRDDRGYGKGAQSADGAYLNGYYSKDDCLFYTVYSELLALRLSAERGSRSAVR